MKNATKGKISVQVFGAAKTLLASIAADKKSLLVGYIYGQATDLSVRSSPDGASQYEGLKGQFEIAENNADGTATTAPTCYLPQGVHDTIRNVLFNKTDGKRATAACKFGYAVSMTRADNADGYVWDFKPLAAPVADDPLPKLRSEFLPASLTGEKKK